MDSGSRFVRILRDMGKSKICKSSDLKCEDSEVTTTDMSTINIEQLDVQTEGFSYAQSTSTTSDSVAISEGDAKETTIEVQKGRVLRPDEEIVKLEDVPPLATWIYAVIYITYIVCTAVLIFITVTMAKDTWHFIKYSILLNAAMCSPMAYAAGCLRTFYGLKPAYSRKLYNFAFVTVGYIINALTGELETNTYLAVSWLIWLRYFFFLILMIPTRNLMNKCLGDFHDENNVKWKRYLNIPSLFLAAFDRVEDRPNTLKWMHSQFVLLTIFILVLLMINSMIDSTSNTTLLIIPTIINGFGDGLAEPVGRRWGGNYQYIVYGCCTEYKYVRSYPGSLMVWLSGIGM